MLVSVFFDTVSGVATQDLWFVNNDSGKIRFVKGGGELMERDPMFDRSHVIPVTSF